MSKFSIILPVRNGGEYLKQCVNSILAQSLPDFNLIVLDNNSTDGTTDWLHSIKDTRIQLHLSPESLSIETNWSRIKSVSKKEFMTMIGHDDLLYPDYLKEMNDLINKHPAASLYQTHFDYIDENGTFVRDCLHMNETQYADEFLASQMKREIDSTGTGYMMRSNDFDTVGGMPEEYPNLIFSDFQLWISLIERGYKATSENKCFSYRLHKSVSRTTNGMEYQNAFCRYLDFVIARSEANELIKKTAQKYGRGFLLYYCEALSHRLLKTPVLQRTLTVSGFIAICRLLAAKLIPGQDFLPLRRPKILIAKILDQSEMGRWLFGLYKKL